VSMWTKYRGWKHLLVFPLVVIALMLLGRSPGASAAGYVGLGIVALLGLAHLAEEVVWTTWKGGRPCPSCGQRLRLKPFRVQLSCPHCGKPFE
jgi:hypothetical protein